MRSVLAYQRLLCSMLLLFAQQASAQQPVFRHYTPADGLPSSEVYSVIQDRKGYMWFGTDRGIAKFDGYTFRSFTTVEGLSDNTIFFLHEDSSGRIWYQPYSSRIGYVRNDTPVIYRYTDIVRRFLRSQLIDGVIVQSPSDLWLCGRVTADSMKILRVFSNGVTDTEINNTSFRDIYVFDDGRVGLTTGWLKADTARVRTATGGKELLEFAAAGAKDVAVFVSHRNGAMALYAADRLLLYNGGKWVTIAHCKQRVLSILLDDKMNLWVGYAGGGADVYEATTNYSAPKRILPKHPVSSIVQDRERGIWLTTLDDGVFYLPPAFSYAYTSENGLPDPKVMKLRKIGNDFVMVCAGGGVVVKRSGREQLEALHAIAPVNDVSHDEETGKTFFIGIHAMGIKWPGSIWIQGNRPLYKTQYGRVSFGTNEIVDHGEAGEVNKLIPLGVDRITCLFEQPDGSLLVGTVEGLWHFDWKGSGRITKLEYPLVNNLRIADIKRIDADHIAIATVGSGVFLIERGDYSRAKQIGQKDGLPSMMCNLLYHSGNALWIGTNKGLARIDNVLDDKTRKVTVADSRNGLVSNEINDLVISGDSLWVATMNGVSVLPRSALERQPAAIPFYIDKVLVNGEPLRKPATDLSYDENSMVFSFIGISYEHTGKLLYKYRLKGADAGWSVTADRTVRYNALPPGSYVFEVAVMAPGTSDPTRLTSFSFSIGRPFWATWWFLLAAGALVSAGVYLAAQSRIRSVKQQAQIKNDLDRFRERALRAQMNPHFIYNAMHSIQNFVRKNDTKRSIELLGRFASLMRLTFTNTGLELIPLQDDIDALKLYAELESVRFPERFRLHIFIDEAIKPEATLVPPFLIQPFVENSILHGFTGKDGKGNIWVRICREKEMLKVVVEDDGIGRERAMEIRQRKEKYLSAGRRTESGTTVTEARIRHIWGLPVFDDVYKIIDLHSADGAATGTYVHFYLPTNYD